MAIETITLQPTNENVNSYYDKAHYTKDGTNLKLYSYNTLVCEIKNNNTIVFGTHSQTTLRHIKEFLKQNGIKADTKKQIEDDYLKV